MGSDLSLLKCRLFFVEISDSEMDKDGVPKWFKVGGSVGGRVGGVVVSVGFVVFVGVGVGVPVSVSVPSSVPPSLESLLHALVSRAAMIIQRIGSPLSSVGSMRI